MAPRWPSANYSIGACCCGGREPRQGKIDAKSRPHYYLSSFLCIFVFMDHSSSLSPQFQVLPVAAPSSVATTVYSIFFEACLGFPFRTSSGTSTPCRSSSDLGKPLSLALCREQDILLYENMYYRREQHLSSAKSVRERAKCAEFFATP